MGALFNFHHANFVAYLTDQGYDLAPRAGEDTLYAFLKALTDPHSLISSTQGTQEDWSRKVSEAAERELGEIHHKGGSDRLLSGAEVSLRLDPLRSHFSGFDLYAMVLPSECGGGEDLESFRFFTEAAVSSHSRGLVLMPELDNSSELTQVVDPFPALRALAENPITPPAVVFWTRQRYSCVLPLDEAREFFREELVWALEAGDYSVDLALDGMAERQRCKRLLHLSDLHFGTREAARRRSWLKEQLAKELHSIDRVLVTGDLFDNPTEQERESFDEFRIDIENMTHKELLVIPGNHDMRRKGNALGLFGRNANYVTDLRWDPVVFDDDLQTVFFSFNSSETGNFATGSVGQRQRLDRSLLYDRKVRQFPEVDEYLKIALVHHHPISYESAPTTIYERILCEFFGGEEQFIAFDHAEEFLEWCASRRVSLVLHGHKHVPHLATVNVSAAGGGWREITIVGCGSTAGVEGKPMCYDIVTMDPSTKRWNVLFYHDEKGDGSGFRLQNVSLDLRI